MPNQHLKDKINKYENRQDLIIFIFGFFCIVLGRFFLSSSLGGLLSGAVVTLVGMICLHLINKNFQKQQFHQKGFDLELAIENKLERLNLYFESNVDASFGDLDFYVNKIREGKSLSYGVEAKNWPGIVTYKDNKLLVNNWDNTGVLVSLLQHCAIVRDKKFGQDASRFLYPVLVFGYKTTVDIANNRIKYNGIDIIITTIKDFDKYL